MHLTAEIRWFWSEAAPADWDGWFSDVRLHGSAPIEEGQTEHAYAITPAETELGIKQKGETGVEVKALVSMLGSLSQGPLAGPVELWCKWTSPALALASTPVRVMKDRRVRRFDTSGAEVVPIVSESQRERTCHVELTRLSIADEEETWWSFAIESAGSLDSVRKDLERVARVLADRDPPPLEGGLVSSVPAWLVGRGR